MKQSLLPGFLIFSLMFSFSTYSLKAQAITDVRTRAETSVPDDVAATAATGQPTVGKEFPVPGGVLFVTPAERAGMQRQMSAREALSRKEKCRQRKLKKQDRKVVTDIIGSSVNNYLVNVTTVHTLQRF